MPVLETPTIPETQPLPPLPLPEMREIAITYAKSHSTKERHEWHLTWTESREHQDVRREGWVYMTLKHKGTEMFVPDAFFDWDGVADYGTDPKQGPLLRIALNKRIVKLVKAHEKTLQKNRRLCISCGVPAYWIFRAWWRYDRSDAHTLYQCDDHKGELPESYDNEDRRGMLGSSIQPYDYREPSPDDVPQKQEAL